MKNQADKLRLIRISKGMSQENVAKALKITVGAYSKIERGVTKLNLDRIGNLADIYDIELNELIRYISGESDSYERKLHIPGAGSGSHSNDQEVLLLKKIINLYEETREVNVKAALKNMFEDERINIDSFLEVLKGVSVNLAQKKLDADQITNFNKGLEHLKTLLS